MSTRKPKKVTRREAVLALGTGLVGGSAATTSAAPPYSSKCGKAVTGFGRNSGTNRNQLQVSACCEYVSEVLNAGYKAGSGSIKSDLKEFVDLLNEEVRKKLLLDYCYIQFDLTEVELVKVKAAVTQALR